MTHPVSHPSTKAWNVHVLQRHILRFLQLEDIAVTRQIAKIWNLQSTHRFYRDYLQEKRELSMTEQNREFKKLIRYCDTQKTSLFALAHKLKAIHLTWFDRDLSDRWSPYLVQGMTRHPDSFSRLQHLSFHNQCLPGDEFILHLHLLPALESLELGCTYISPEVINSFPSLPQLRCLCLTNSHLFPENVIFNFSRLPALRCLTYAVYYTFARSAITGFADLTQLHSLSLINPWIALDDAAIELFGRRLTSLRGLELNCKQLTERGFSHFSSFTQLHHLALSDCRCLTDQTTAHLISQLTALQTLRLEDCSLWTDHAMASLVSSPSLERFLLFGEVPLITDAGWSLLVRRWPEEAYDYSDAIQIQKSLAYCPSQNLGKFYQAVLQRADNLKERFDALSPADRELIETLAQKNVFDPHTNLCEVVKAAIMNKFSKMPDQLAVHRYIYKLAGCPRECWNKAGEDTTNLCRLADALELASQDLIAPHSIPS